MSKKSENIKRWRRRTKKRLVMAFSNKCCVCNNEFDPAVYDFHHVDGEKGYKISSLSGGNIRSWGRIVSEVRKCVMVCANCHRLVHTGIKQIPHNAIRFDEKYAYYDPIIYPELRTKSGRKVYHLLIQKHVRKSKYIVSRKPPRNMLKILLDRNSIMGVSRKFGVSHTTIRRWAKTYKLVK